MRFRGHGEVVAARASSLGRLRITHRDGHDFYLTAADREDQRDETLTITTRILRAFMHHDHGVALSAIPEVFPWARHLSETEIRDFTVELLNALSDAVELENDLIAREVVAGWRATARIKADPEQYAAALSHTSGDLGRVEVIP
jgi:glycine/D-amino acid oxidase-like deaminating enzyme